MKEWRDMVSVRDIFGVKTAAILRPSPRVLLIVDNYFIILVMYRDDKFNAVFLIIVVLLDYTVYRFLCIRPRTK